MIFLCSKVNKRKKRGEKKDKIDKTGYNKSRTELSSFVNKVTAYIYKYRYMHNFVYIFSICVNYIIFFTQIIFEYMKTSDHSLLSGLLPDTPLGGVQESNTECKHI